MIFCASSNITNFLQKKGSEVGLHTKQGVKEEEVAAAAEER